MCTISKSAPNRKNLIKRWIRYILYIAVIFLLVLVYSKFRNALQAPWLSEILFAGALVLLFWRYRIFYFWKYELHGAVVEFEVSHNFFYKLYLRIKIDDKRYNYQGWLFRQENVFGFSTDTCQYICKIGPDKSASRVYLSVTKAAI